MLTQPWRLLITPPLPGARNMAIDQAITEHYAQTGQPTLRLYRWTPRCLSLGIAQRLERDVDRAACAAHGIDIVRRATGGRAILHDQEVTYALIIATDHPCIGGTTIVQSYRAISAALCAGLAQLGAAPQLAPHPERHATSSAACFDTPGAYEITIDGRKLVGSAQARQQGVLLQHGTILLHADVATLAAILKLPPALSGTRLAQRLIALDEIVQPAPTFEDVAAAVVGGFERAWGVNFVQTGLSAWEQQRAEELLHKTFGNPAWTERR